MSEALEQKVGELEETVSALYKELIGTQEMLAFVLQATGDVVVSKEALERGLPKGTQIKVDDDVASMSFVFGLEIPDE